MNEKVGSPGENQHGRVQGSGTPWARVQTLRRPLSWETRGARCLSFEADILNSVGDEEFHLLCFKIVVSLR